MKRALLAATALVTAFSPILTAPALADDDDNIVLSPVNLDNPDGSPLTPQEVCDEALKPAANSGFMTEPTSSSETGWADSGSPVRGDNVGDPVPTGTPTITFVIPDGGYYRNGGSPNVWAHGTTTLNYSTSMQEYEQFQNQTDTVTVSCRVWKYKGNGDINEPHGLQTTGNVSVGHQKLQLDDGFDTNNGPISLPGQEVYALICISPGKKGGSWVGKNAFPSDQCAAANSAAGGNIPSGNVPVL